MPPLPTPPELEQALDKFRHSTLRENGDALLDLAAKLRQKGKITADQEHYIKLEVGFWLDPVEP